MSLPSARILLISAGLNERQLRLQPWRYLYETARQLTACGHSVTMISDGASKAGEGETLSGLPIRRLPRVGNPRWRSNQALQDLLRQLAPDVILWHVGLTSFLHQAYRAPIEVPVIGIFTSPIYRLHDLTRLGLKKLITGYQLSLVHLLGAATPRAWLRRRMAAATSMQHLVVQTRTVREQLREQGLWQGSISVIPPGVDPAWRPLEPAVVAATREKLGYRPADKVVVYFGSPAPLRGLPTLVAAFERAARSDPALRLLILSRRREDELIEADTHLRRLVQEDELDSKVQVISGFLPQERLVRYVAAADIVALPFEIVPSDAPLSVLEARAIGKRIVTTSVACLPEIACAGRHGLALVGDPQSLASALQHAGVSDSNRRSQCIDSEIELARRVWDEVGSEWATLIDRTLSSTKGD